MKAKVVLLRVYRIDYDGADMVGHNPVFYEAIEAKCKENAVAYLDHVQERLQSEGLDVQCFAEEGDVVQTILSIADREGADLIAMSSHGRTGLSRVFYGSVAAGVLHKIDRPLLLVRAEKD
jgi:nucleotide-binding universal stress UspA family protein